MFEVRNLSFSYGNRRVLRDVSFVVSPGEIVSVVGANGVGKSTLLKVLATLLVPDGGMVLTDGQDALSHPLRYRRQIGYLPERVALCEEMTVKDYLRFRALLKGEPNKRVRRRIGEAAELCRISEFLGATIRLLSSGIRKRVALADAMLLRPRVLLLDDFLAGLDLAMRSSMEGVLKDAASFSSVIVTGHEVVDFANWTSRFLLLKDGAIAESVDTVGAEPSELVDRVRLMLEGGQR